MNGIKAVLIAAGLLGIFLTTGHLRAEEKLSPAPEGSFSIVVIPDTQAYHGKGTKRMEDSTDPLTNAVFQAHVDWIARNLGSQKIAFVSHVGDIVDKNQPDQWELAVTCMDVIHGKVPYGISVGNHDMTSAGDSSLFQQSFPKARFEKFDWYGGCYAGSPKGVMFSGNNANSYQLFSAGGTDFLFLHLECNAPDDVLEWANQILRQYPQRTALITSHMGWGPETRPKVNQEFQTLPKGRMQWAKIHKERGNTPQQMWEKCYCHHSNLLAVFSGDQSRSQAIRAATPGEHGNVIHEFLQDYMQEASQGGWLRLYRFLPAEHKVQVFTFRPTTEVLCEGTKLVSDRGQHQFEFPWNPSGTATSQQ